MSDFAWRREKGERVSEYTGRVFTWDVVQIADHPEGLITGQWLSIETGELEAFVAFVQGIRDEVQK